MPKRTIRALGGLDPDVQVEMPKGSSQMYALLPLTKTRDDKLYELGRKLESIEDDEEVRTRDVVEILAAQFDVLLKPTNGAPKPSGVVLASYDDDKATLAEIKLLLEQVVGGGRPI